MVGEVPLQLKPKGRKWQAEQELKRAQEKAEKAATLAMIAVSLNAAFGVAALTRGPHWELDEQESRALAQSLDAALNTLPGSIYGEIKAYVEKVVPWVSLAFIGYSVIGPRIREDNAIRRATEAKPVENTAAEPAANALPFVKRQSSNSDGGPNDSKNRFTAPEGDTGFDSFGGIAIPENGNPGA